MDKGFRRDTGSLPRNHAVDRRPTPVAQVLGVTAPEVAASVTWAERGLLTAVAVQGRLASAVGPDGGSTSPPSGARSVRPGRRRRRAAGGPSGLLALGIVMITLLVLLVRS
jgi:hypothetical protein